MAKQKAAQDVDKHVGARVKTRRMMIGLSQEKLGDALGLTFQQVQKYEKGANRISAGRLFHIASILRTTTSFFYEGAPSIAPSSLARIDTPPAIDFISSFSKSPEGVSLARAFEQIGDKPLRRSIVQHVEQVAASYKPAHAAAAAR